MEAELRALAERFGQPLMIDATIHAGFVDPVRKPDRVGEVCMVVRRPNGKLLLSIKTIYPRGAHRLPTGGIKPGEPVLDALVRETLEETGLTTEVCRFLAQISYRDSATHEVIFHTFAFLLEETGGTLGAIDLGEQIEEYIEVDPSELLRVADSLELLAEEPRSGYIQGSWRDWGIFRAVVHRAVYDALRT